ncbi:MULTISPECIES: 1-acyl-sn-glycerol-3-phosphate acyltransferase [Persicobacter]|uniref:1-acyl-sn-glycerol-3-phosphate acyltransferase n=1 Tax=Persicobacter diffluens TaxID=981 RepID=A0AAN4VY01_9BACT|nr:1-acyl-sn-glycerol-3-phosphate acyltransferase [Persicobacter sp. CCB-QB2]GJM60870.1 1-acyl-sn-glycerol-3-phosphate acyltransferase [Persicobacter diffluens]
MWKFISKIIFKVSGWKIEGDSHIGLKKAVVIAAPHTSNWDFIYARAAFFLLGLPVKYTIKREWTDNKVFGGLLKRLGAIGIDRRPKGMRDDQKLSMVEAMANLYKENDEMMIMITPEGTRKYVEKWKSGFYRLAEMAEVPIALGYLDFERKRAGIHSVYHPTGNYDQDLEEIMSFYRTVKGKHPELGVK